VIDHAWSGEIASGSPAESTGWLEHLEHLPAPLDPGHHPLQYSHCCQRCPASALLHAPRCLLVPAGAAGWRMILWAVNPSHDGTLLPLATWVLCCQSVAALRNGHLHHCYSFLLPSYVALEMRCYGLLGIHTHVQKGVTVGHPRGSPDPLMTRVMIAAVMCAHAGEEVTGAGCRVVVQV
jgi:hypothetical protein